MWSLRINISFIFLLLVSWGSAQVEVNDNLFANYLCNNFGLAMNEDCAVLDTNLASSEYSEGDVIRVVNTGLQNADEVIYFANIDSIKLNMNSISSFPSDLSRFRSLTWLNLGNNHLSEAPIIRYTNSLGIDTAIKIVYLFGNKIGELPDQWGEVNNFTQVVDVGENVLTSIPSFSNYPEIRRLDVRNNLLNFDYLIPIKQSPVWETQTFELFPQSEFEVSLETSVSLGDTIKVDVSEVFKADSYRLLKGNSGIEDNFTGYFEVIIQSAEDTGTYWFKSFSDQFLDDSDFLQSKKYEITLEEPTVEIQNAVVSPNLFVFSPDGDGVFDFFQIDGTGPATLYNSSFQEIRKFDLPFDWYGYDSSGRFVEPGIYLIQKEDKSIVKVLMVR